MKAVYKYPLKIDDYQQVILPVGAETLCVKVQNGNVCLWALIDKEYTDHDWGVYKYNGITKDVALELIRFSENNPDNVCLGWYADKEYAKRTKRLFNLSELRFYLYYYERDLELCREIEDNETLRDAWSDSDCYTLTDESIDRIKARTQETKKLLLALLKMNEEFEAITYNK